MPSVLIEVRRAASRDEELALIEMVHAALREAFHIPPEDRNVRLVVHEPRRFACPPNLVQPELYTHISVDAPAGCSLETRHALYRAIVHNLEAIGIPADHVTIVLREISHEYRGIRAGLVEP
jgi:hypothetical protein